MRTQAALLWAFVVHPFFLAAQDCRVPVLRRGSDGFSLRFETIAEGRTKALVGGPGERVITPVVPASPGMSGDVVRGADERVIVLRCDGDRVRVLVRKPAGGPAREAMAGDRDGYERYVVRVNAVAEDGEEAAFTLRGGRIAPADGPVIDMFRGMVPLGHGDVVVTTEIREAPSEPVRDLRGSVELGALGPYAAVPVELPGGRSGRFILDLAASRSLVFRELLPPGTPVQPLIATERSAAGEETRSGTVHAAGGAAASVASVAELDWLGLGDLRLDGFRPLVLDEPFEVDGAAVDGVLGLDVLRRAGRVRGSFGRPEGSSSLHFGGDPLNDAVEIPLREVRGLLFVDGRLGDLPVLFLLDSGARLSVLPERLAEREGWTTSGEPIDSLRGLDGAPLPVRAVEPPALRLGTLRPPPSGFTGGPIPVLDHLGLRQDAGILGQPFWQVIGVVEVDFEAAFLRIGR